MFAFVGCRAMETIASLSFWQPKQKSSSTREASVAAVRISMAVEDLITRLVAESRRRGVGWRLLISRACATRGRRLPSLDTRTVGDQSAPIPENNEQNARPQKDARG